MLQTRCHGQLDSRLMELGASVGGGLPVQARYRGHRLGSEKVKTIRTDCDLRGAGSRKRHYMASLLTSMGRGCRRQGRRQPFCIPT